MFVLAILLDWTENENKQYEENLSLPFSAAMRPSKLPTKPTDDNTFMGAFMKHLQQGKETTNIKGIATVQSPILSSTTKSKTPREPKKPRKKKEKSTPVVPVSPPKCTTIGLQIQIHDPISEPASETPLETSFESDIATYPLENVSGTIMTPTQNLISNSMVELSPSLVTAPSNNHHTTAYYELGNQPIIVYDPDPATYNGQSMNMMPNECINMSGQMHRNQVAPSSLPPSQVPNHLATATGHHPYAVQVLNYSDQNESTLISHFNVSHTNVNNTPSVVHDQVHSNWRAVNEIMLNK